MTELIFIVEEAPEGGYTARALGASIYTEGDTLPELQKNIREAVQCHFDELPPKIIHLHYVKKKSGDGAAKINHRLNTGVRVSEVSDGVAE